MTRPEDGGTDPNLMTDVNRASDPMVGPAVARDDQPQTTSRAGMDYTPPQRTGAFKAAGRHTARVRFLRRAIIIGALFGVSVIALVAAFDPFRHLPGSVSIGGVGLKGTKITMDTPKISGVQQGGGPYSIAAKTGIQDITTPNVIELVDVDANVGMSDQTTTHILASHGVYDSKEDTMDLNGNVRISNTSGYTFSLKRAFMDFKAGVLSSEERTRVDLKGGDVNADQMRISNNGHLIVFTGHVDSTFVAPEDDGAPAQTARDEAAVPTAPDPSSAPASPGETTR